MNTKFEQRKKRAQAMMQALNTLWPQDRATALNHSTPWELLVATILSAQSTDKMVNEITKMLFKKYPTFQHYLEAKQEEFEQDVLRSGFFRNKTKHILAAAQMIHRDFGGLVPREVEKLLMLPGVARKTAVVVLSNAFGIRNAGIAVDTHVKRFVTRFDLSDSRLPEKIEIDLMKLLPSEDWFAFHNKIIYYGREICPARPHDCADHPLTKVYPPAATNWPKAK